MTEHSGNCRCVKVTPKPREYRVTISDPDGKAMTVHIPEAQVNFLTANEKSKPFSTATWLAYCDLWVIEE